MRTALASVVAVTGLPREQKIIARGGGVTLAGYGNPSELARSLGQAVEMGAKAFISMGISGGLAPGLSCGSIVIGAEVVGVNSRYTADLRWSDELRQHLPNAVSGVIVAQDKIVATITEKAELYRSVGGAVVDMESHTVAGVATRYGLPFAVLRVVADTAHDELPPAAIAALGRQGRVDFGGMIFSLISAPAQLPSLIALSGAARHAATVLLSCGRILGAGFGFPHFS